MLVVLGVLMAGCARGPSPEPAVEAAEQRGFVFVEGALTLDGVAVPARPSLETLSAVVGPPDRTTTSEGSANVIHTWDALGLLAYDNAGVRQLTFELAQREHAFSAERPFTGLLSIDGVSLRAKTRTKALERAGYAPYDFLPGRWTSRAATHLVMVEADGTVQAVHYSWSDEAVP